MTKPARLFLLVVNVCLAAIGHAGELTELERAIRELPPRFVADIPLAQRDALMQVLRRDKSVERLDLKNGYLHWFSDSSDDGISATSMLYMRQFRRADGGSVVLAHMPKPFAKGLAPRENQTFVFAREENRWKDITGKVFPPRH